MRKLLLLLTPIVLAVIVFCIFLYFSSKENAPKGALQVTSLPQATVYLDNKDVGKTPFCKCDPQDTLPVGQYTLKLVSQDPTSEPYEEKITINESVLTVVDRTFGDVGKSSGSVITLSPITQKIAQLFITTFPIGASIAIDSNAVGVGPITQTITQSDHEVTISKDGYKTKTIHIHGITNYKLTAIVTLATQDITQTSAVSNPSISPQASTSGQLQGQQVIILDTPTGFLRVRDTPSLSGAEIAQVHPKDTFQFISEQDSWIQIKLPNGKLGWVSTQYAQKLE